jgi:hypothetical protein
MEENTKSEEIRVEPLVNLAKAHLAAKARERTARLHALGLTARGNPRKDRHKSRDAEKQRQYQASYNIRQKAARARLGLTIAEFKKLPRATRMMELNYPAGITDANERRKMQQRKWYHKNKGKAKVAAVSNGVLPADDRSVKFCPHCGWNIDATRKAQAFIDGRVA